jgi:hypothetical protein
MLRMKLKSILMIVLVFVWIPFVKRQQTLKAIKAGRVIDVINGTVQKIRSF